MEALTVRVEEGELLLEGLLRTGLALSHDCRGRLACATCRVVVREGAESLSDAAEDEQDILERVGAPQGGARLACQAIGRGGEIVVELPDGEAVAPSERVLAGPLPLALSETAARYLAAQLKKHPAAAAVRIAVEPAGCSGLRYRLGQADEIGGGDRVFESDGVCIVIDSASLPYLQGARLDLVQEGLGRRLRFDNPNARRTCGCGESFAA